MRSPLNCVGGKFYSREHILSFFPPPKTYTAYCEVFGGAAHVLLAKPTFNHLEIYNDYNNDLVNFWMQCRDNVEELQQRCSSLPYARSLYNEYHASLWDGTMLEPTERAVRWFYVLRSSFSGNIRKGRGGWGYAISGDIPILRSSSYHSAISIFQEVSSRFRNIQIECQDFEKIIKVYERPTTFFYCDPPYIGHEDYYGGVPLFDLADHERLAQILNATPAKVALSYYPDEKLDEWYPTSKWRRMTWEVNKHSEGLKAGKKRQKATELMLMNYPPSDQSLWDWSATASK